jgi:hypothetical protein
MTVLSSDESRSLLIARLGLLVGFGLLLVFNALLIVYTVLLIFSRGDPQPYEAAFYPVQSTVLSLDLVAVGMLAVGFWAFGAHHDTIRNQAQNMSIGFAVWTVITLSWRLPLLWTPTEEVNPVSRRFVGGEFGMFMPHFEFLRVNYMGFLISGTLMFILMLFLVRLIRNYRVYENFQSVNLNLFQIYGVMYMAGTILMGLGWWAFSPGMTGTTLGDLFLVIYVFAWLAMFLVLPILGLWVFFPAFSIHRSAVETLQFILRRKSERERSVESAEEEAVIDRAGG